MQGRALRGWRAVVTPEAMGASRVRRPGRYHTEAVPTEEQHDEEKTKAARERVERMVRRYVERGPYRLHPDPVTVEHVLAGLTRNLLEHGRWYCPCREVAGDPERDRRNICPCPQHRADIARDGFCECGIFVSLEYAAAHSPEASRQADKEA